MATTDLAGMRRKFADKLKTLRLVSDMTDDIDRIYMPLANMIAVGLGSDKMHVIGVNGAQGAGKTSFCELMKIVLEEGFGKRVLCLSIDDLYLSHADREKLARQIHPLLKTRGVPGTHYVEKGLKLLHDLAAAGPSTQIRIPRFDKATDDVVPESRCDVWVGRPDVVLFDGWFMGAEEQPLSDLLNPINDLEKNEDKDAVWRTYVNLQLKTEYSKLFDELSLLVMLKVPSMEKVYEWRELQENKLRAATEGWENLRVMTPDEVRRFIAHYERLTSWMLQEMPQRADVLLMVNEDHRICLP